MANPFKDFTWFNQPGSLNGETYTPGRQGGLSAIGKALSGISAPFVGDMDWALKNNQMDMQQQQADMEFQKFLIEQNFKEKNQGGMSPYEMAIISKLFPEVDINSMMNPGAPMQTPGMPPAMGPTGPQSMSSPMSPPMSTPAGIPSAQYGMTGFKMGNMDFGQTPESKAQMEIAKEAAKIPAKQKAEGESLMEPTQLIGNLYNEALGEVSSKIPNVGASGFEGIYSRLKAKGGKVLGDFPKLKAFEDGIKAYATDYAKGAGEARPTDEDIKRFLDTLPTVTGVTDTTESNSTKMRNQLLKLKARGVSYKWAEDVANQLGVDLKFDIKHKGKTYKIPYDKIDAFNKDMGIKQ